VAENDAQRAKSFAELRERTDDELIGEHDRLLSTESVGIEYYLNELARRTAERQAKTMVEQTRTMVEQTKAMVWLTRVITVLTLTNLGFVIYAATN
jgi:hypothetical protein